MPINSKTATAVIALMIAGAYPMTSIAQDDTNQSDSPQIEVTKENADQTRDDATRNDDTTRSDTESDAATTGGTTSDTDSDRTGDNTESTARSGKSDKAGDADQGMTSSESGASPSDGTSTSSESSSTGTDATGSDSTDGADRSTTDSELLEDGTDRSTDRDSTSTDTTTSDTTTTDTTTTDSSATDAATGAAVTSGTSATGATEADGLDAEQQRELDEAAADDKPVPPQEMLMGVQREDQWLSSELISKNVHNPDGDTIGDIGGIIFGHDGPEGVIVEVGGFLGIGKKKVAIHWDELRVTDDGIVVDATKDELKNAPEFVSLEDQGLDSSLQRREDLFRSNRSDRMRTGTTTAPSTADTRSDAGTGTGMTNDTGMEGDTGTTGDALDARPADDDGITTPADNTVQ